MVFLDLDLCMEKYLKKFIIIFLNKCFYIIRYWKKNQAIF